MAFSLFAACNNDQGRNRNDRYDNNRGNRYDNNRDNRNDNNRDDRNTSRRWSQTDEDTYLNKCENTFAQRVGEAKAREVCNCVLEKYEKIYSSYDELGRKLTKEENDRIANECYYLIGQ
jgi:hypothetical protein